jgi:hypothetical protein
MRVVSLKLQASGSLEHRLAFPVSTWHVHVHVSRTPLDRRGFEEACCRSTPCVVRYLDRAQGNAQAGSFFTSQTHQASRCSARRPGIHCHDMRICETGPQNAYPYSFTPASRSSAFNLPELAYDPSMEMRNTAQICYHRTFPESSTPDWDIASWG